MKVDFSNFLSVVLTIAAVASAIIALIAIATARRISQAEILARFRERYSTDQMLDDLRLLRRWSKQDDFANKWFARLEGGNAEVDAVDRARRRVGHYFAWIGEMYHANFITREMGQVLLNVWGLDLYLSVVVKLDAKLNAHGSSISEVRVRGLRQRSDFELRSDIA